MVAVDAVPVRIGRVLESPPEPPPALAGARFDGTGHAEGIYLHSGELWASAVDLHVRGRGIDFVWGRKYRSRFGPTTSMGAGWDFSYNLWIEPVTGGVRLHDGNTRADVFRDDGGGEHTAAQFFCAGRFLGDASFRVTFADLSTWTFRPLTSPTAPGRVQSIADRHGNALTFQYDAAGRLSLVLDTLGRAYSLAYDGSGRIASLTDFTGRSVSYAYDANGDLRSATSPAVVGTPTGNDFPLGKTTRYAYSSATGDARLDHNLLTITDPSGRLRLSNEYATTTDPARVEFDRVVRQTRGAPGDTLELAYVPLAGPALPAPRALPGALPEALLVVSNDRVGNVSERFFDVRGRKLRERAYTGRALNHLPTTPTTNRPTGKLRADDPDWFETRWEHDSDSLVTRVVHPAGDVTRYVHESALDPLAPARARGNLRELRREPGTHALPADQVAGTVELFEYESSIGGVLGTSFLRRHVDARGNVTQHVHDAAGNRIQTIARIPSIADDYTYDAFGRVTSHTGPVDGNGVRRRDDYLWYGPADGAQSGYLRARVDDAAGLALTTTWTYDARGRVLGVTDPRGNDTTFVRNALDQVVVRRSPPLVGPASPRHETRYRFDLDDQLVAVERENRDETGVLSPLLPAFSTVFAYGARGELVFRADQADAAHFVPVEFASDGNGNLVLVREGEAVNGAQPANTITLAYDERDLAWRTTRAAGSAEAATDQTDYDANGNVRALRLGIEGTPAVETRAHDALDRLRARVDALGNVTTYHYDPNGNPGGNVGGDVAPVAHPFAEQVFGQLVDVAGSVANRRLSETTHTYDALDRLVRTDVRHFDTQSQAPIGDGQSRTTCAWTGNSLLASVTLDGGAAHTTSYTYDALGRLVQRVDAEGNRRSWSHDAAGNVIGVVDLDRSDTGAPDQMFTTTYGYDALDRLVLALDGIGLARTWGWDGLGRCVRAIDRGGRVERYEHDGLDRLVRVGHDLDGNGLDTDPSDVVLTQQWDDSSRCVARTDGASQTTRFAWDALDRHIATLRPDGTLEQSGTGLAWPLGQPSPNLAGFQNGHDVRDNLVTRTDANGTRTTTVFDQLDRATSVSVQRAPGVGGTTSETWQYDGLSRMVRADVFVDHVLAPASSSVSRGSASTSGYDSLGNVLRESRTIQGGPTRTVVATFDGESALTELTYPSSAGLPLRVRWTYDGLLRPRTVADTTSASVTLATLAYVGADRLERLDRPTNGTRTTCVYDGIAGVPNPPGDFGFAQEIERRHVRITSGASIAGRAQLWAPAGTKSNSQDLASGLATVFQHDALDRLVHSSSPFDPSIDYALDQAGSRTFVSGGGAPGPYASNAVHAYVATPLDARAYDPAGNLVGRNPAGSTCVYDYAHRLVETSDGANVVRYRYDGLGRCVEKSNGGTVERYDYDPLGRLIEVQNVANTTQSQFVHADDSGTPFLWRRGGARYFLHTDHQGSVVCVTDPSGNVAARYRYSDFGEHVAGPASTGQSGNLVGMALSDENVHCTLPPAERADDFVLAQSGVITSLRWWGGYDCSSAPFSDSFVVSIRDDAGGLPGNQLYFQFVPNIARTATGQSLPGTFGGVPEHEYSFALNVPFNALAGVRYWLCIRRAGDGQNTGWSWESSGQGDGTHAASINFTPWTSTSGNRAFELELAGPAIPLSPFLFHGHWYDADSGLYRIGSRAYEPAVGAFLQRDPRANANWIASLGRAYTFASNAPTSCVDDGDLAGGVFGKPSSEPSKPREAPPRSRGIAPHVPEPAPESDGSRSTQPKQGPPAGAKADPPPSSAGPTTPGSGVPASDKTKTKAELEKEVDPGASARKTANGGAAADDGTVFVGEDGKRYKRVIITLPTETSKAGLTGERPSFGHVIPLNDDPALDTKEYIDGEVAKLKRRLIAEREAAQAKKAAATPTPKPDAPKPTTPETPQPAQPAKPK